MVGYVRSLHRGVEALDASHVSNRGVMDALLAPAVLHYLTAALAPAAPNHRQLLYRCKGCSCSPGCYNYATGVRGTPCPVCKGKMATKVQLVEPDVGAGANKSAAAGEGSVAGYVRDRVTYMVMDDLLVAPKSATCVVTALAVTDISGLQATTVEIGYKEGMALLKASLQSKTVLTDVFLGAKGVVLHGLLIWDLGVRIGSGATFNFGTPIQKHS